MADDPVIRLDALRAYLISAAHGTDAFAWDIQTIDRAKERIAALTRELEASVKARERVERERADDIAIAKELAVADLTRELEEARAFPAIIEADNALLRREVDHLRGGGARGAEFRERAVSAETALFDLHRIVIEAIDDLEEGWRGTKLAALHARLSRASGSEGETNG